jgi:hypothetical protein
MSQKVSTLESSCGAVSNSWLRMSASPAFFGFNDGAGVVYDQPAQHGAGVLDVTKVPGAVECVQARHGQVGRIANVVQPCGGFQEIGVSAENRCPAPSSHGDAMDVRPAAGEGLLEEFPGLDVRPMKPACSCGQGQTASAGRSRTWHAV